MQGKFSAANDSECSEIACESKVRSETEIECSKVCGEIRNDIGIELNKVRSETESGCSNGGGQEVRSKALGVHHRQRLEYELRYVEGHEAQAKAAGVLDPALASMIAKAKKGLQAALDNL